MISSKKLLKLGSFLCFLSFCQIAVTEEISSDKFPSQVLYEKMYAADFNGSLVRGLIQKCSGDLIDFSMVVNFPQVGYFSRKHLMEGGALNNIIKMVFGEDSVWGEECGETDSFCEDSLTPLDAGADLSMLLYQQSTDVGSEDLLCDYLFWDYVDEFALTAEQLIQETLYELYKRDDPKIIKHYKSDVLLAQSKVERLANSKPGRVLNWQMDLAINSLEEFQVRRFTDNLTRKNSSLAAMEINSFSLKEKRKLISSVQTELKRLNCYAGKPDGIVGPISKEALKNFSSAASIIYDEKNFLNKNFLSEITEINFEICSSKDS